MLPLLRRAAPSRIVNVGSMFGDIAYPLFASYSASKFALRGLSIALRREFKLFGIGVTYAAPRATKTDAAQAFDPLVEPMQMRIDDPARSPPRSGGRWRRTPTAPMRKGPERLFVLVQRLLPRLVDRAIAAQMADPRVRTISSKRQEAVRAAANAAPRTRVSPERGRKADRGAKPDARRSGTVGEWIDAATNGG